MHSFTYGFNAEIIKTAVSKSNVIKTLIKKIPKKHKETALKALHKVPKINPGTQSWALSRGATAGAAGALSGGIMYKVYRGKQDQRLPKAERRKRKMRSIMIPGAMGVTLGLTKGLAEKGLDRWIFKLLTKGKR